MTHITRYTNNQLDQFDTTLSHDFKIDRLRLRGFFVISLEKNIPYEQNTHLKAKVRFKSGRNTVSITLTLEKWSNDEFPKFIEDIPRIMLYDNMPNESIDALATATKILTDAYCINLYQDGCAYKHG